MRYFITKHYYDYDVECYDFNKLNFQFEENRGLKLFYSLAGIQADIVDKVILESRKQEDGTRKWKREFDMKKFSKICPTFDIFLAIYNTPDFDRWQIDIQYDKEIISISGTRYDTRVEVLFGDDLDINIDKWLSDIEEGINIFFEIIK